MRGLVLLTTVSRSSDCSTAIGRVILMPDKDERDKPWYYAKPCMMHIIEVSTGIVCTCLPTMRITIKEAFSRNCFGFGCAKFRKMSSPVSNGNGTYERDPRPRHLQRKIHVLGYGEDQENGLDTRANLCWRSDGCHTEITRSSSVGDTHWDESGSRQILVTEEIDVELRAVERVAERNAGLSNR